MNLGRLHTERQPRLASASISAEYGCFPVVLGVISRSFTAHMFKNSQGYSAADTY